MNTSQVIGSISALLPILVSGGVLYNAPIFRYINIFFSGYRLYLRIAGYGLAVCLGTAMLLAFFWKGSNGKTYLQGVSFWLENRLFITAFAGLVLVTAFRYTILLPLEWHIINKTQRLKLWLLRRATRNVGFEEQIVNAIAKERLLMVTTDYGKVYVGNPVSDGGNYTVSEEYRALSLLPVMSGYRDTETQEVELITSYARVIEEYTKEIEENEESPFDESLMHVVIPMRHIIQIRYFDENMYEKFRGQKDAEK